MTFWKFLKSLWTPTEEEIRDALVAARATKVIREAEEQPWPQRPASGE